MADAQSDHSPLGSVLLDDRSVTGGLFRTVQSLYEHLQESSESSSKFFLGLGKSYLWDLRQVT
jgi:hypothetical protein